ncbi:RNA polymerase sigma-I factor [Herbivorax sp. ANBcel31]|nr:RNA polymerase sigma-I factor [Herbivorax sp. ANBcel31]MDQ2087571.1 RNA polymerase sigma-I factor [Herbivorax sp. ANBcel31]
MGLRRIIDIKEKNSDEKLSYDKFISTIKKIKEGNHQLRNDFISKYTPFIIRVTSNALGRYVDTRNNDEFSVALSAFNEAINSYDLTKTYNFFMFSEQVIKRRLIDYSRRSKHSNEFPFSYFSDKYELSEDYLCGTLDFGFEDVENEEEIDKFKKNLNEFGISFMDLVLCVPKHRDSRKLCIGIAKTLAEDEALYENLLKNKSLPRKELKKKVKVHTRTLGNNRKYIIALCLILKSNLELSKRYLKYAMEGGK